ncbi:MAG: phosphohistidine phosphatase SixA [Vibrio sp.]
MKIYIMRHGEAQMFANSDEERALTDLGRLQSQQVAQLSVEQMKTAGDGEVVFDLALVSPYLRAQQTWQEIEPKLAVKTVETSQDITPYGDSEQVAAYLNARAQIAPLSHVLIVSHLPLVGYLTAEFATGIQPPMFATSSMACVEYDENSGCGELLWHIQA